MQRHVPLRSKRGRLRARAENDTNIVKDNIQALARSIVIIRDGGCILRNSTLDGVPECNGLKKDGTLILQADHLITRGNAATYSDTRLIVCVCKGHHHWKTYSKERYDAVVRSLLSVDRVVLWDRAHAHRYEANRKFTNDWRLDEAALKSELAALQR